MDGEAAPFDPDRGDAAGVPDAWRPAVGVPDAVAGLDLIRRRAALVQGAPTLALSDGELREVVAEAVAARAAVEAWYLHVLAALDARGPGAVPGASASHVAATFLVHAANAAPVQAGRDVRAAAALAGDGSGIVPADEQVLARADAVNPGGWLPRMGAALAAGLVSRGHVDVAVRCLHRIPKHLLAAVDEEGRSGIARVDAFLAEHARRLCPPDLDRVAAQLVAVLDPDGADGVDPDARRRRYLSMRTGPDGMLHGSFALDAAAGAVVKAAIEMVVKEQVGRPDPGTPPPTDPDTNPNSDPGEGEELLPIGDDRSVGQRRADALHQVCLDALRGGRTGAPTGHVSVVATPDQVRDALATTMTSTGRTSAGESRPASWTAPEARPGPRVEPPPAPWADAQGEPAAWTAPVAEPWTEPEAEPWTEPDAECEAAPASGPGAAAGLARPGQLRAAGLAETGAGDPLAPGVLAQLLCGALLTGVLLDAHGAVLDLGRTTRLATAVQRRALTARDRGCIVPGCAVCPPPAAKPTT